MVPVRNGAAHVTEALDALADQVRAVGGQIVVVDDASTDETPVRVEDWSRTHPDVDLRLVRRTSRGGPNASRNDGVAVATADFLCFTDGDDVVAPDWLTTLIAARRDDAILGGSLVDLLRPDVVPARAAAIVDWGVPFAYGGNFAVARAVIDRVGPFLEGSFAGATEWEFCRRALVDHGIPVVGVPDAVVRYRVDHRVGSTFWTHVRRQRGRCWLRVRLGADVVVSRGFGAWLADWRALPRQVRSAGPDGRRLCAARLGDLTGRAWWNLRFRCWFW